MQSFALLSQANPILEPIWERLLNYGVLGGFAALVFILFIMPISASWKRSLVRKEERDEESHKSNLNLVDLLQENNTSNTHALSTISEVLTASLKHHETTHSEIAKHSNENRANHALSQEMIDTGFKTVLSSLNDLKQSAVKHRASIEKIENEVSEVQKKVG